MMDNAYEITFRGPGFSVTVDESDDLEWCRTMSGDFRVSLLLATAIRMLHGHLSRLPFILARVVIELNEDGTLASASGAQRTIVEQAFVKSAARLVLVYDTPLSGTKDAVQVKGTADEAP